MNTDIEAFKQAISACEVLIKESAKEQQLRDTFTSYLRKMFPDTPTPWWIEDHIQRCESNTKVTIGGEIKNGFVDNLVGRTVIEYERNLSSKRSFDSGYSQIKEYGASLIRSGHPVGDVIGVLSDTIIWYAYDVQLNESFDGDLKNIGPSDIILNEIHQVTVLSTDEPSLYSLSIFLDQYLGRVGSRPLSAGFIARDLGFDSQFFNGNFKVLLDIVNQARSSRKEYSDLIKKLWENFVVYAGDSKSKNSFDVNTYTSELYILTLAKLICANCLSETGLLSKDQEVISILNGKFFQARGVMNLVEYDYFGWLCDSPFVEKIIPLAKKIQRDIRAYDYKDNIEADLFGELMAQLASRSQRLLLGQEWTPNWLAEQVVDNAISNINGDSYPQFVDMCCGSGAMAVHVIGNVKKRLLKESATEDKIFSVLERAITGFDIDPMAVLLAKISWLLSAKSLLSLDGTVEITIPIFNADSLFAITAVSKSHTDDLEGGCYSLKLGDKELSMPSFLVSPEFSPVFDKIIDYGYRQAMTSATMPKLFIDDNNIDESILMSIEGAGVQLDFVKMTLLKDFLVSLIVSIDSLQRGGLNGLWAFLLRNSYRPGLVYGNFNGLVSNPPWLTLSKVANNPYKNLLKEKATYLSINPGGASHPHVEMATIFLLHSIDNYLKDGASIACVLPESVLNGKHHQKFRDGEFFNSIAPIKFEINEIWKVEKGSFKNEALVLFGSKDEQAKSLVSYPIKGKKVHVDGHSKTIDYNEISIGKQTAWSENEPRGILIEKNEYRFRQGADLMPRTLYFFEFQKTDKSKVGQALYKVCGINNGTSSNKYLLTDSKKCVDFRLNEYAIPEKFIFNAYISKHLAPFTLSHSSHILLPAKRSDGIWVPLSEGNIASWSGVRNSFSEIKSAYLKEYDVSPSLSYLFDSIDTNRKKLSRDQTQLTEGFIVLFGAGGSNPCSAYLAVSSIDPEKLVIDQTLYWDCVETEDEAAYLVGLINSTRLKEIISEFQPKGQQGERHIHTLPLQAIPSFNKRNRKHIEISTSTKRLINAWQDIVCVDVEIMHLLNPNKQLAYRRRAILSHIEALDEYQAYNDAVKAVL